MLTGRVRVSSEVQDSSTLKPFFVTGLLVNIRDRTSIT